MTSDPPPTASAEAVPAIEIRRSGRHFAVYERGALLALVCYKVGAIAIKHRIEALEQQLAAVQVHISDAAASFSDVRPSGEAPWSR